MSDHERTPPNSRDRGEKAFDRSDLVNTLVDLSMNIQGMQNFDSVLNSTLAIVLRYTGLQSGAIYLVSHKEKQLYLAALIGGNGAGADSLPLPCGIDHVVQAVFTGQQPVYLEDTHNDPGLEELARKHRFASRFCFPLMLLGRSQGVLDLYGTAPRSFPTCEREWMQALAANAGALLAATQQYAQPQVDLGSVFDTAHLLISTLDEDQLLQHICLRLSWLTNMDACAVSAYEKDPEQVYLLAQYTALGVKDDEDLNKVYLLDKYPLTRQVLQSGEPLLVRTSDPGADLAEVALLEQGGYSTLLMIPLIGSGKPVGLVELYSERADRTFTPEDYMRLRALCEQVALALINARHYQQEQRARLTAETLRHATAALTSTLELNQVLDLILEQLQLVVHYDSASLMLIDHDEFSVVATHGHPNPQQALSVRASLNVDKLAQAIVTTKESIILPDAQNDARFQRLGQTGYVRGWMGVPLITREEVIGLLTVDSRTPGVYTARDASISLTFAEHAALAVTNARLYQVEHEHRTLAEVLREISLALSGSMDTQATLEILLEQIGRAVPYDTCCVMMLEGDRVRIASQRGFEKFGILNMSEFTLRVNDTPNLILMSKTLRPHYVPDVKRDAGWVKTASAMHVASWVGAPLVARGKLLGFLSLDKVKANFYSQEHAAVLGMLVGHASLALDNAIAFGKVELESITDFLTNTHNHRYFQQQIREEMERAQRQGHSLSMLMIDIDNFKKVNDAYGHITGDQILRIIATRFKQVLRSADFLARYGGEEFTVILPGTSAQYAQQVGERLRKLICDTPCAVGDHNIDICVSIGVASYPAHASGVIELISCADQAMYQAKEIGRNRVIVFDR